MIELNFTDGFLKMEQALVDLAERELPNAIAKALTRTAVGVMGDVRKELPSIFDRPTPFTVSSVRYGKATRSDLQSRVYISEDAPKGISPRKYLAAEIEGGGRGDKRSEKALKAAGLMQSGQQLVPGSGMDLDQFGNIKGATMVRILSRVAAFGQQGYAANASDKTKKRLAKAKMVAKRGGTDFFVAHSKRGGEPLGIYQLMGPGVVRPVLWFVNKRPSYQPRFPFERIAGDAARVRFPHEMMRAIQEEIARRK